MTPEKLARAINSLTLPIPPARRPSPKSQASWQELKVGQRLQNTTKLTLGTETFVPGFLWQVEKVDSLGATLNLVQTITNYRLTRTNWTFLFERVKAPRKRKVTTK